LLIRPRNAPAILSSPEKKRHIPTLQEMERRDMARKQTKQVYRRLSSDNYAATS
jgi:hypothetical protein